jgi:hypothetical protein
MNLARTIQQAICLAALGALAACSGQTSAPEAAAPKIDAPYNAQIDVLETMVHVMDPQARQFWAGWGYVADEKGVHDVSAKTEEDWKKVEDGAAAVVLVTNTLMLPAYQREPQADWIKWAKQTGDLAMEGKQAAERKDVAAIEEIGGRLDTSCDSCHEAFRAK